MEDPGRSTTAQTRLTAALADRYRVGRELGAGGMAAVYLAHDLKHDRDVAIKVLHEDLGATLGPERFLAEIKTTAKLQHPHILPLLDSGEAGGLLFYVMPYVAGETLRDRLTRETQLPIEDASRIAREVADALGYAHGLGIIHRDIKPENILLQGGHALVADFGIALAVQHAGGARLTQTGLSLGTPQYMAPEQAMGEKNVDHHADIYALGAVAYEMLTGEPPFTGASVQAVVARAMAGRPTPVETLRDTVPENVSAAVMKALAKLPADRFESAARFAEALGSATPAATRTGPPAGRGPSRTSGASGARIAMAVCVVLGAVLGAVLWNWIGPTARTPVPPIARFSLEYPRDVEPGMGAGSVVAFSPDGGRLVYSGHSKSGQQLYSRSLDELVATPIPGTEGGSLPFFSADGASLGFRQGHRIVKVALAGGVASPVSDVQGDVNGASWTAGDTIIFATSRGLEEVPAAGGDSRVIATPDSGETFEWPVVLPDGRAVLFSISRRTGGPILATFVRGSGTVRRLKQRGAYPQYVAAGFVVFSDPGGFVSAAPFDPKRLEISGTPTQIIDKLQIGADGDDNVSVSRGGAIAYLAQVNAGNQLVLVDRHGQARGSGLAAGFYNMPRLSPDGGRVALVRYASANLAARDVWIVDLVQHAQTRLTFDSASWFPYWAPDGRRVAFTRNPTVSDFTTSKIFWVPVDGSGTPDSIVVAPGSWAAAGFFTGGRDLLYCGWSISRPAKPIKWEIRHTQVGGGSPPESVLVNGFNNRQATLSPDGRWFAYTSDEGGAQNVYVRPFPGPGGRSQVSLDGGSEPLWSPTGREIFYRNGERMMTAAVRTQGALEIGARTLLFTGQYDVSPWTQDYDITRDGQTFLMLQPVPNTEQSFVVILNWFDQLRVRRK